MKTPEFEVENGIPVSRQIRPPYGSKYPFAGLKPGQSFFVPGGRAAPIASAASEAGVRTDHRYTVRTVDGGVRVWRLPDETPAKPAGKRRGKKRGKK